MPGYVELERAQAASAQPAIGAGEQDYHGALRQALRGQPLARQEGILAPAPWHGPGNRGTPVAAEASAAARPGSPIDEVATGTRAGKATMPPPVPSRVGRPAIDQLKNPGFDPRMLATPSGQPRHNDPPLTVPQSFLSLALQPGGVPQTRVTPPDQSQPTTNPGPAITPQPGGVLGPPKMPGRRKTK